MNTNGLIYFFTDRATMACPHTLRARIPLRTIGAATAVALAVAATVGNAPALAAGFEHDFSGNLGRLELPEPPMVLDDPCLRNPTFCEPPASFDPPPARACLCSDGSSDCCD